MKKTLALLLLLAMVASFGAIHAQAALEEITILYPGEPTDQVNAFFNGPFAEKMAKELNLKVNMKWLSWANYWDQKSIMFAANEPIDLYWDGLPSLAEMVNKKEAQPLDELMAKYWTEDLYKVLPKSQLSGGKINGVQYGIPTSYAPSSGMYQFVCLRQDMLEAAGMKEVKTAEDLRNFALKVQAQFPQMKGPADVIFKPLTRYFGDEVYFWVASQDLVVFGDESHKAYSYAETTAFEKVARFNREMYLDGLYQDDLSVKYNERESRMQTGLYLWLEGSLGKETEIISNIKTADPNAVLKSYLLAPERPRFINATGGEVLCIPYGAKNPDGAMKFLAWMLSSRENYLFCLYGEEGKDYKLDEKGRLVKLTQNDGFLYEWMFRNGNYQVFTPDLSDEYIENYKNWDKDAQVSKMIGFAFNNEKVKDIETACNQAYAKLLPILYGFVDYDENYPNALKELKAAGIDKYVEEVNAQLEAYMKNNAAK